MILVVGEVKRQIEPFYKAIVVKPDIFSSEIVDEIHFKTADEANHFKLRIAIENNDLMCIVCPMC